ncbi:MAG: VanW family protein [Clostridia bacterium]
MFEKKRVKVELLTIIFIIFFATSCGSNKAPKPAQEPAPTPQKQSKDQEPVLDYENLKTPAPAPTPAPTPAPKPAVEVGQGIGYFQTTILDKSRSRVHNIKLASEKINGFIVQPGQEFSFNGVVGQRLPEKGFQKAIVLIRGKRAYEEGGGICQISSTLYNSAEKAGLEIVERHSHSKDVHYLPMGQDAAIAYGSQDLRFKNTRDFPIKLHAYVEGNKMITNITRAQ